MSARMPLLLTVLALACGPKAPPAPPVAAPADPLADRPEVGPAKAFSPATPQVRTLASGATLWVVPQEGLPLVSLRVRVEGGAATDPADKPGLTALADELLTHGAGDRDATAFAAEVERLALDLGAITTGRATVLTLSAHADRLDDGLDLLADAMLRPRFDADEVERVREQQLGSIKQSLDDPRTVASTVAWAEWYGPDHPLAHPTQGTEAGIAKVRPERLRRTWARRADPSRTVIVASGAVSADALAQKLDARLEGWEASAKPLAAEIPPAPAIEGGPTLRFVHVPDAAQTVLRVHLPGWSAQEAQGPVADLGVIVLGGTFTSRLNRLLREEKGYTYGARAGLSRSATDGVVVVSTNVRQDATAPALVDLLGELKKLPEGISDEELQKAVGSVRTDAIAAMATRGAVAGTYLSAAGRGQGPGAVAEELAVAQGADVAAVNSALQRLDLANALVVVAGDLDQIRESVEEAVPGSWEVVEPVR